MLGFLLYVPIQFWDHYHYSHYIPITYSNTILRGIVTIHHSSLLNYNIPSGKLTVCPWKWPFSLLIYLLKTVDLSIVFWYVYQSVIPMNFHENPTIYPFSKAPAALDLLRLNFPCCSGKNMWKVWENDLQNSDLNGVLARLQSKSTDMIKYVYTVCMCVYIYREREIQI